ncbi:MAG: SdrD B-like domain-containing protein, partial [Gemmataceae bacterium]
VDRNNNGAQDAGEIPLAGVTMILTGTDILGSPITLTTTTAGDGSYLFAGLLPGSYRIDQVQPDGYGSGIISAGTQGGRVGTPAENFISDIVLGPGTNATGYNFAELGSSLAGRVYADNNLNGVFNADTDRPIPGITVRLQDNTTGQILRTTTTAADGTYAFLDLPAGNYTIIETQPPLPTTRIPANANPLTYVGSEFFDGVDNPGSLGGEVVVSGPGKNEIRNINLGLAQDGVEYNFGEIPPADPFGFVYIDANNNGQRDSGEIGIPNVTITISGTAFAGTPFERPLLPSDLPGNSLSVLTDANGRYEFNPMPPGIYSIVQTQPAGFLDGLEENADPNGPNTVIVGNDRFDNIVLNPFPIRGPFNFGELGNQGEIRGSVYVDRNNNGVRDPGEIGIPGVTVRISGIDLAGRAVSATVVTDANGNYVFRKMSAGTYRISQVQPHEFLDGIDRAGTAGGRATNDVISNVNLGVNQIATGYLFGERGLNPNMVSKQQFLASSQTIMNRRAGTGEAFLNPPGDPSGFVFLDLNNNGRRDPGEPGIQGARVILTGLTFDGQRFRDVQYTNSEGFYEWDNLLPGTYSVRLIQPLNFRRGQQQLGSLGGIIGPNIFRRIIVRPGDVGVNYNFGQLPLNRTPVPTNASAAQVSTLASSVALITPPLFPELVARYTTQRQV